MSTRSATGTTLTGARDPCSAAAADPVAVAGPVALAGPAPAAGTSAAGTLETSIAAPPQLSAAGADSRAQPFDRSRHGMDPAPAPANRRRWRRDRARIFPAGFVR